MSIKTIIVDDEAPARRRLIKLLQQEPRCKLIGEAENGNQAIDMINRLQPDLVLLDIQLKDITGFDVLQGVSAFGGNVIFITAYDSYAIQAFDANAIDYLLKPFKNERFQEALSRAVNLSDQGHNTQVSELLNYFKQGVNSAIIKVNEGKIVHHVNVDDLVYIASEGYYCHFHMKKEEKMIRISLKQLESILPLTFVRINRSTIVNTNKISACKKMKNSAMVQMVNKKEFTALQNLDRLF